MSAAFCVLLVGLALPQAAKADSFGEQEARFASGTGYDAFLIAGIVLPLLESEEHDGEHALRALDAIVAGDLITQALKSITHEWRPDDSDDRSFPSGHATMAFAVATVEAEYHPKQAVLWYLGAAMIAESRVELKKHYIHDVIAGAAVGYFTAQWEIHSPRGLLIYPFIKPDDGCVGMQIVATF